MLANGLPDVLATLSERSMGLDSIATSDRGPLLRAAVTGGAARVVTDLLGDRRGIVRVFVGVQFQS
jgi:hypothetical protein